MPVMAGAYIIGCLYVITMSWEHIPFAIKSTVANAFGLDAMAGGGIGAMIYGFQRAIF